jgi:FixJ family two-component response regulator
MARGIGEKDQMLSAKEKIQPRPARKPRVLVVDDEPGLLDLIDEILQGLNCKVSFAKTVAGAKKMLAGESFELMLTDVGLPDGDWLSLLAALRRHQPTASAVVITGSPSVDGAITALRGGAVDFVAKPFNNDQLVDRIRKALDRQSVLARQEKRLVRLRDAVKRLGVARRMVSKKVDLLCNDLVSAYGELSKQLDVVRTQEGFRKQIETSKDLEQMLCQAMDWLLREFGYSNVALWLAGEEGEFQLGAYMKYTIAGEEPVIAALHDSLLIRTTRDGLVHIGGEELVGKMDSATKATLVGQTILSISCTYLGEPLAVMTFFRDAAASFSESDVATLRAIAPLFASSLAAIVRDPSDEQSEGGEGHFADDDEDESRGPGGRRADDWWKRGEPPPF